MRRRKHMGLTASGRLKKGYRFLKGGRIKKCDGCSQGHYRKKTGRKSGGRRRASQGLLF